MLTSSALLDHFSSKHKAATATTTDVKPTSDIPDQAPKKADATTPKANGSTPPQTHSHLHRPGLLQRNSSEKTDTQSSTTAKGTKDPKQAGLGRRGSWMTSLSSKFSSTPSTQSTGSTQPTSTPSKSPPASPGPEFSNPFGAAAQSGSKDVKKVEAPAAATPNSPKTGHTFIHSALRRLSSSGGSSLGKTNNTGTVCPRKTMNIDPYRDRCVLPDVDQNKLRRVAFCVDVEIAGAAQYVDAEPEAPPVPPLKGESSLSKLEQELEAKKKKDMKQKKGEGAALKSPNTVVVEKEKVKAKEKEDTVKGSDEEKNPGEAPDISDSGSNQSQATTRKKEKKKRSEGERKERKEKKHQDALANGEIPVELNGESSGSATDTPPSEKVIPNSQAQPTTDPLRIYRRCCQLRETPIREEIADQISSPSACPVATPGIVTCLDLTGVWMQLTDLVTLGDYLAVVPVKRLILENCGLGDEAVRVILAGLLAAKTPEQAKYNKKLGKKVNGQFKNSTERLGVIEKLVLKNNSKIGKTGWRHIALFINMSRSLKAIDLSMIPFPIGRATGTPEPAKHHSLAHHKDHPASPTGAQIDMPTLFQEAIGDRLEGNRLEELIMAECGLDTECIGKIVDGVMRAGCTRLGLAGNNISLEGLRHVIRWIKTDSCGGLDLGGNDFNENLDTLAEALDGESKLWALCLADCHISPASLEKLLPALVRLPHFRFLDISHNRDLFSTKPTALNLIRKYLPQLPMLKRIHLKDVALTSEYAIALAEVLPECRTLAHLNILENHLIIPLASAKTESEQEEACALYASLMAAVRVSHSIICIDIDVPSDDSSEIVKALARQVVAYSLRNLEQMPLSETSDSAKAAMVDPHGGEKQLTVPDILLHLVGHVDDYSENHDNDEPAPDDDYIVGGTGVVKALDICLNRAADGNKDSRDLTPLQSGTGTPVKMLPGHEVSKGKAKDMSKNLLESARKIRGRLQPALVKEAKSGNEMSYSKSSSFYPSLPPLPRTSTNTQPPGRLQFLDTTLDRMIQRFETEYPETRLPKPATTTITTTPPTTTTDYPSRASSLHPLPPTSPPPTTTSDPTSPISDDSATPQIHPLLPHRTSSPSLATRQAQEEGLMHRFGQRIKRDIFTPPASHLSTTDPNQPHGANDDGTTNTNPPEAEAEYLADLRARLEAFEGEEIRGEVERRGPEAVLGDLGVEVEELRGKAGAGKGRTKAVEEARRLYDEGKGAETE